MMSYSHSSKLEFSKSKVMRALLTIGQQAPSPCVLGAFTLFIYIFIVINPPAMKLGESQLIGQQAISCNARTFVKI